MANGGGPVNALLMVIGGTIVYLVLTPVIATIHDVTVTQMASDTFAGTASQFVSIWILIGALLLVADVAVIFGMVSSAAGGTR